MQERIMPERLKNKQKKHRSPAAGRQLGLILFTLFAVGLIAYGAYYFFLPKQESFLLDFYTYSPVGTRDFLETLTVKGSVVPKHLEIISPKIAGVIEEILVAEGEDVQRGDPLFLLYSEEIVKEKDALETELKAGQAKLGEVEIDRELDLAAKSLGVLEAGDQLEKALEKFKLQETLYSYGAVARVEVEAAEQAWQAAKRRLEQLEREQELLARRYQAELEAISKAVELSEEKLTKILQKMEDFTVTARSAGRILSLKIPNNRIVSAHQELGELADLQEQAVEVKVAPGQAERFGLGAPVTVSLGQAEYEGEISYIAPQAVQGADGSSVLVKVELKADISHLRPYSAVTADIHLRLQSDSLFLPRGAYLASGQQLFVYVLEGEKAKRKEVQFGMLEGNAVQILSGLEIGEKVITSSYDAFRHLEEIRILPEGGHEL